MSDNYSIEDSRKMGNDPLEHFYCRFILLYGMESFRGKTECSWTFYGTKNDALKAFPLHLAELAEIEHKFHHLMPGKKEQG